MSREPINWGVNEKDIKEFVKAINVEIPIDKYYYQYVFQDKKLENALAKDVFKDLDKEIINRLYKNPKCEKYKRILNTKLSLSYIPNIKDNNWYIGYSPIEIYNNIYETLGIKEKLDYINYNDKHEVTRAKNIINIRLIEEQLKVQKEDGREDKLLFIDDSIKNIDNVFKLKDYNVENSFYKCAVLKNLLYYLSVKSLDMLYKTEDIRYAFIPRQYYFEVANKIKKSNYPNQLMMDKETYECNYNTFNRNFSNILHKFSFLFENTLGIDQINIIGNYKVLKEDDFVEDVQKEFNTYVRKDYTKTDEQLNKMLLDKMNFYKELINKKDENDEKVVVAIVKGIHQLDDYYGFILKNNYIVLDKFFTINKKDKKIKPAYDEAVFTLPLDLYVELNGSKRKIKKYKKDHPKGSVSRNYHTEKNSYMDKIQDALQREDISTMKSDWFLSIYAPKKLVLKNKLTSVN